MRWTPSNHFVMDCKLEEAFKHRKLAVLVALFLIQSWQRFVLPLSSRLKVNKVIATMFSYQILLFLGSS